jgi:hypothetical protein
VNECKTNAANTNLTTCFSNPTCEWRPAIPENCTTFEHFLAECPVDRCDVDFSVGSCLPKKPKCESYEKTLDLCPQDRCQVDMRQRTCREKGCGNEFVETVVSQNEQQTFVLP